MRRLFGGHGLSAGMRHPTHLSRGHRNHAAAVEAIEIRRNNKGPPGDRASSNPGGTAVDRIPHRQNCYDRLPPIFCVAGEENLMLGTPGAKDDYSTPSGPRRCRTGRCVLMPAPMLPFCGGGAWRKWMIRGARFNRSVVPQPEGRKRTIGRAESCRTSAGPSEVSVDTHCPAKGIEEAGNEDAPLAMTEGGIKPKRLGCQTDDETPPTSAAEQYGSDRPHEYRGLGGKLQPRSFCTRRCLRCGYVLRPPYEQPQNFRTPPQIGPVGLASADPRVADVFAF